MRRAGVTLFDEAAGHLAGVVRLEHLSEPVVGNESGSAGTSSFEPG
ncbi:hypothetical protein [Paractinoplanes ferrugineus]|nr:hypothetical protein [Actinoplanes ferrugineus]